jgi:co-chaperonin GroES (HSP10)
MSTTDNKYEIGELKFEAFGDRIIVKQDEFKSGYECEDCGGSGYSKLNPNIRCRTCDGRGALLVIPEVSERRPTTGQIVSIGPAVKYLKVGQCVMFSSFAGHNIDLDRAGHPVVLTVLHEPEVLTLIEGHMELRSVRGKTELASFHK